MRCTVIVIHAPDKVDVYRCVAHAIAADARWRGAGVQVVGAKRPREAAVKQVGNLEASL